VTVSPVDLRNVVAAKRDGKTLAPADIEAFVRAYVRGDASDALVASFLMAALLNGLDDTETLVLTTAMIESGRTVSFDALERPTVDKHSTGGVADGVTLVFAPLAAAMGLAVAKLSGRGLGHTGGTLDKLESIPGLRTDLTPEQIQRQVAEVGCAVAAQTADLVPADGAMYALRDATATVPSVPLIAASIMSKKLAVDTDLILLDVKAGSGAFMKTPEEARGLAAACRRLARDKGRACRVAVTDMSQPLGDSVGNALDIAEAIGILRGETRGRLRDLTVWFAGRASEALLDRAFDEACDLAARALDDGSALERFRAMVRAQGGDPAVADDPSSVLPAAPTVLRLLSDRTGWLASTSAEAIGLAAGTLGAGRARKGDPIDPSVGIVVHPKIGDRLEAGQDIGEIHARDEASAEVAATEVLAALDIAGSRVEAPPMVHEWME
jgi:pyrimidine-nucleoside phosphorylase